MAEVHQLKCDTNRRNTGYGGCPVDWNLIKGFFLFDSQQSFTPEQLANFQLTLQTMAWQDSKAGRAYPVHKLLNPTDGSEAAVYQTFSDGSQAKVRDGINKWSFQFTSGGFCLLQALQTHNGNGTAYVIFYDKNYTFLGTSLDGELATIPMQVFNAETWKMNTGQAVAVYMVTFIFDPVYVNQLAEYTRVTFNPEVISGLQDIRLLVNSFNPSTGLVNVTVATECGGANLYDQYSSDLVDDLWSAINDATGGVITISSVTPVPASKSFNVTLSTVDADYPTSGGLIGLSLVEPSLLDDAGIAGYEAEITQLDVIVS